MPHTSPPPLATQAPFTQRSPEAQSASALQPQNCSVQPPPAGAQIPQDGLQHHSPAAQVFEPHATPLPTAQEPLMHCSPELQSLSALQAVGQFTKFQPQTPDALRSQTGPPIVPSGQV